MYGEGHPKSVVVLRNFGNTLRASSARGRVGCTGAALLKLGRLDDAMADYERSLAILESCLGPTHRHIGRVLANISNALVEADKIDSALGHRKRAKVILMGNLGPDHPDVAAVYIAVGKIRRRRGQPSAAQGPHPETEAVLAWLTNKPAPSRGSQCGIDLE